MASHALDGQWTLGLWGRARGAVPAARRLQAGIPARVPGTVHVALMEAGIVKDPYQGREELAQQWIDEQDWAYEREVVLDAEDCARARRQLRFDGIDTVAEVQWDSRTLARSANMFRALDCDLPAKTRPGRHLLRVIISSPTRWARAAAKRMGGQPRADAFRWQTGESRDTYRTAIRKTQCHFGWDWGAYLATSGIWQRAALDCSDAPRISAVRVVQAHHGPAGAPKRVELTVRVALEGARAVDAEVVGVLMGGPMPHDDRRERRVISALGARAPGARRRGRGARLQRRGSPSCGGRPTRARSTPTQCRCCQDAHGNRTPDTLVQVGLRTIAVETPDDRAPDGSASQGLRFVVNGRPVWAKGANWIPPDQFVERCTRPVYRHLLASMVDANMNMVRVWGGGWYEQDAFYDLCDELGILVWQDMMMACGFYPDHQGFLAELDAEECVIRCGGCRAPDLHRALGAATTRTTPGWRTGGAMPARCRGAWRATAAPCRWSRARSQPRIPPGASGRPRHAAGRSAALPMAPQPRERRALLGGVARAPAVQQLPRGEAALRLRIRLPILPRGAHPGGLRRACRAQSLQPRDGAPPAQQ